jgi:hypothetical protein
MGNLEGGLERGRLLDTRDAGCLRIWVGWV